MGYNEGIGKVWLSTHNAVGQIVAAKTCGRLINLAVGIRHMGPLFPDFLPISFSDTFFYLVKKSIPRHFQDDRQCLSLPGYFVPPRSYSV